MTRPEWIEVGRVSRQHGVHGEVRVRPDSDNPERFTKGAVMHARPARAPLAGGCAEERTRLTIASVRGETSFPIVSFEEVRDREGAGGLRGFVLEVPGTELPDLAADEYYPFDIEGMEVRDTDGLVVGRVREVIEAPAHPLLAVSLDTGCEVLVPFVLAVVPEVSLAEGYLVIESGFLE